MLTNTHFFPIHVYKVERQRVYVHLNLYVDTYDGSILKNKKMGLNTNCILTSAATCLYVQPHIHLPSQLI